ncbi:MAG: CHAD domain-containing protein [Eggerthellaceae bacterium]|nr:CHAD domain-containing protein [Eggerthellaceae bacterium]
MTKTIVIMRHAKAKRPVEGQPDIERPLSEAGKRSMRATLCDSLAFWPKGNPGAEIWSSPAERTRQTAELLTAACKQKGIDTGGDFELLDCLWEGDAAALKEALKATEAETVFIVGHNPFVEDWVRELTGSRIVFATGAMACIAVDVDAFGTPDGAEPDDGRTFPHRLLWFAQGPISQRWKTLVTMEKVIAKAVDTVHEREDAFFADPDDAETMHKLRVSIRTLRSLIAFVRPWQDRSQNDAANADLRDIVAVTSRLRELDVLAEQARESSDDTGELVAFCEEQAAVERASVMKALSSKALQKKLDRVSDELRSIKWKRRYRDEGIDPDEPRRRFDAMAEELQGDLETLDFAEVEKTHDVRKQAKRVRYSAERFSEILGDDAVQVSKDMTAHQDNLGAICDARVNIDIINGFALNELPEPIAWDLALLRAENETFLYKTLRESR